MKVIKLEPQGFCHGVKRAIEIVNNLLENSNTKKPIYILGHIIHNKRVCNELEKKGVITIEENNRTRYEMLDDIKTDGTVIISAHGASPMVKEKATKMGLNLIDASCPYVLLIQNKIIDYLKKDYEIYYIGTQGHPECEGVLEISPNIHLIDNKYLVLPQINNDKVYITNQTTLSSIDLNDFYIQLKQNYPQAIIDDKICHATSSRQQALLNQEDSELLFVVGDTLSSNSKKLRDVSIKHAHINSVLIENVNDIDTKLLKGLHTVSVTSGASTPSEATNEVIEFLKEYKEE